MFMRKLTFLACAALLTSAVALNSCKSDEPINGPQGSTDVVKTEFVIKLPDAASNGALKMPSTTVPANDVFMGMKNIAIIPFATADEIARTDVRLGAGRIAGITDIPVSGEGALTNKGAKLYSDISIPLTTASFLVYAEANNAAADNAEDAAKHTNGVLIADTTSNTPATMFFDLLPVLGTTTLAQVYETTEAENLLALLNAVADASDGTKAWEEYTSGDDAGMVAMWETYKTMHALSSFEVKRVLEDLYKSVEPLKSATPATKVSTLAAAIQTAIKTGINVTGAGTNESPFVFTYKDDYAGYPASLNIPDGSVRIKYAEDPTYAFVACAAGDYNAKQTAPDKFVYPTSLWYYANSTIKTANKSMSTQYVDNKTWDNILDAYDNASVAGAAAVNSLTRSVAIINPIQYAVGRLDVFVKLSDTDLEDGAGQTVSLGSGNFPLSAVFIGNQRRVLYDFKPDTISVTPPTKYTVYDNVMYGNAPINITTAAFTATPHNSTFVLETPAGTSADDANANVQIAIELTNNSESGDFIGANGQLIPAGGKFYLVATLKATSATTAEKRVFIQDYLTKAQLTITSLAGAYNEIPDLRTPKLELGMSVDLSWQSGTTYEINL